MRIVVNGFPSVMLRVFDFTSNQVKSQLSKTNSGVDKKGGIQPKYSIFCFINLKRPQYMRTIRKIPPKISYTQKK